MELTKISGTNQVKNNSTFRLSALLETDTGTRSLVNMSDGAKLSNELSFALLDPYGAIVEVATSIVTMTLSNNDENSLELKRLRSDDGIADFSNVQMDISTPNTSLSK